MKEHIPQQQEGGYSDTVSTINFDTEHKAIQHFEVVKKRFFDVNSWELFAGEEKASFSLHDSFGNLLLENPEVGDYFRIKIPGLHNPTGDGFDWVIVEEIKMDEQPHFESVYVRVRPTSDPTKPDDKVSHFFDSKATSNFLIQRKLTEISAEVHGRNEEPNTENLSLLEKARNFLVAVGGMVAGSKFQWKSLTEGLIKNEE